MDLRPARIAVADLERFIAAALAAVGVAAEPARTTARVLAMTDAWGVFTHGVKNLNGYVARLRAGGLVAGAVPTLVGEGASWALLDAGSCLGMVSSTAAMERAVAIAKRTGIGFVGVRNGCHIGAAGAYAHLAAERGCFAIAMQNDAPSMTVPGGKGRILGNNPFAFACPLDDGHGVLMLDMALSTVAGGKLMAAHTLGQRVPADWSVDVDGEPTTDPGDFVGGGALTPMAGHKGYGLALMVEAIAGALTGAALGAHVGSWVDPTLRGTPTDHGSAFIAIDTAIAPGNGFAARLRALTEEVLAAPAKAGARILLPGQLEAERRARALVSGIVLPGDVAANVRALAGELGIDVSTSLRTDG
ncbi:MAG TPA: Ldh family oxidoreductase [Planctomycetota bacterium]|nr:Ldh family oxidoreductase [Planctomycetota bacterium]